MDCTIDISVPGSYYIVELAPDDDIIEWATPAWGRRPAESVYKGSFITTAKRSDGTWIVKSILIPSKGLTEAGARKIAVKIADKLKVCES